MTPNYTRAMMECQREQGDAFRAEFFPLWNPVKDRLLAKGSSRQQVTILELRYWNRWREWRKRQPRKGFPYDD